MKRLLLIPALLLLIPSPTQSLVPLKSWTWSPECTPGLVAGYEPNAILMDTNILAHLKKPLGRLEISIAGTRHIEHCVPKPKDLPFPNFQR
jgi:hypothetical protein